MLPMIAFIINVFKKINYLDAGMNDVLRKPLSVAYIDPGNQILLGSSIFLRYKEN